MIPSPDGASGGALDPAGYLELLEELEARVRATQVRAARAANTEVLALYWSIGRDVLARQDEGGWGARVVDRLAGDLRAAFPDQRGWSRRNLRYLRAMAAAWPVTSGLPAPRRTAPRVSRRSSSQDQGAATTRLALI